MNACVTVDVDVEVAREVDPIEEMRLRTWARRNYAPSSERNANWHPVISDEMTRIDQESAQ
jgi:hypothetical protein